LNGFFLRIGVEEDREKVEADDGDNVSQAFFMASVFQFGVQGADVESRFVMEFFCKLR
jgi:hypothetical protein